MVRKIIFVLCCLVAVATGTQSVSAEEVTTEIMQEELQEEEQIVLDPPNNSHLTEEEIVILASETAIETISDIYDEGTLNSTYTTYFRDYVGHLGLDDHYVYARTGQYVYTLFYGDISLDGTTFRMGKCTRVDITTSSGYNSSYTMSSTNINSYTLNVGNNIVYSDLGAYPMFEGRGEVFQYVQTITICVMGFVVLLRWLFNSSSR